MSAPVPVRVTPRFEIATGTVSEGLHLPLGDQLSSSAMFLALLAGERAHGTDTVTVVARLPREGERGLHRAVAETTDEDVACRQSSARPRAHRRCDPRRRSSTSRPSSWRGVHAVQSRARPATRGAARVASASSERRSSRAIPRGRPRGGLPDVERPRADDARPGARAAPPSWPLSATAPPRQGSSSGGSCTILSRGGS